MNQDSAPSDQPLDAVNIQFFMEDLENFSHITVNKGTTLVKFVAWYSNDDHEIVYNLS